MHLTVTWHIMGSEIVYYSVRSLFMQANVFAFYLTAVSSVVYFGTLAFLILVLTTTRLTHRYKPSKKQNTYFLIHNRYQCIGFSTKLNP